MERHGEEVDVTTTEARGGSTPHIVRYVLIISVLLAAAAMTIIWITGALSTEDAEEVAPVTNQPTPAPEVEQSASLEATADEEAALENTTVEPMAGE